LNEYKNRKSLGKSRKTKIEPVPTKTTTEEVRNLVHDNNPFNNHRSSVNDSTKIPNNNATNSSNTEELKLRHKRKHNHSNSNSDHSSNHNHGHKHKRSHHSHGKSHNHERRRK
jgi:ABC-type Zn2+ transport system substrate-binding protein/surface adhesin